MVGPIWRASCLGWILASVAACASPGDVSDVDAGPTAGDGGGSGDASMSPTTIAVKLTAPTPSVDRFVAAYLDGSGAWALAAPATADTFTFVVASPTWSFAWACEGVSGGLVLAFANVLSYAVAEKTNVTVREECPRDDAEIRLRGTVGGTVAGTDYSFGWGGRVGVPVVRATGTSVNYQLLRPAGTHDLYAAKLQVSGNTTTTTAVAVVRGLAASADTSNVYLSMTSALATPVASPGTIQGVASEETYATTTLFDPSGTSFDLATSRFAPPHVTRGIASSQMVHGAVYEQLVEAFHCPPSARVGEFCDGRTIEQWRSSIAAQAVTLPPALGAVTTTAIGRAVRTTWAPYPNAAGYTWVANKGYYPEVTWRGTIGAAYAGSAPRFEIPDLSSLPGWDHFIPQPHGDSVIVGSVRAHVSSSGNSDFPFAYPAAAGTERLKVEGRSKITY